MNEMLGGLDQVRRERFVQPARNAVDAVPAAIRALADGTDQDRRRAYHRLLYALGNDHAGTCFPVVLPAVEFLGEVLRDGALVARLRTLDVLLDLLGSFWPEPAYEEVETDRGRRPLRDVLHESTKRLRAVVERRRQAPETGEEAKLAGELLELLDE